EPTRRAGLAESDCHDGPLLHKLLAPPATGSARERDMKTIAGAAILLAATTLTASGQAPAPMNKFAEACALCTETWEERAGSYNVTEWMQQHRVVTLLFSEFPRLVRCEFRDLRD